MFSAAEEIKNKLDIVDVVSQYVQLKKAGHNYKGLCPFHREKTPSFMVSQDKQIAYCFGCHKGGDIFRFLMELERIEFPEALRTLAKRAGVQLEPTRPQDTSYREKLLALCQKAKEIFSAQLQAEDAKEARKYLEKRGLSSEEIQTFSLGYAPDSFDHLYKQLLQLGYSKKEILDAGLATLKEFSQDSLYDKFRGRIIFPIHTHEGDTVAFAGRVLGSGEPKYLNSAETPLYHKSSVLYNLDRAKEAIREKDFVLVVEGYMDAISVAIAGIANVVAVCGTALTEQQVKLLKRYTHNIYFCFDSDEAGMQAMQRNAEPVIRQELLLKVVDLGQYKDPDEYIRADKRGFENSLATPHDFLEFLMQQLQQRHDISTLEGRRSFINIIFPLLRLFPSATERELYIRKVADILQTTTNTVLADMERLHSSHWQTKEETIVTPEREFDTEHYLIGLLLTHPDFLPILQEKIPDVAFEHEFLKNVYKVIVDEYNGGRLTSLATSSAFSEEERGKNKVLLLLVENEFPEEREHKNHFVALIGRYGQKVFARRKQEFLALLRQAQKESPEQHRKMLEEYHQFLAEAQEK